MRVSFVLPTYPSRPSGGYRVVYQYANGLAARGHGVTVIHPRWTWASRPLPRERLQLPSTIWRLALAWHASLRPPRVTWHTIDRRVRCVFLRQEPRAEDVPDGDAVIATSWQTGPHVAGYPATKGVKVHYVADYERWIGADDPTRERMRESFALPLVKLAMSHASAGMAAECAPQEVPIHVVPLAIDHGLYRVARAIENRNDPVIAMAYRTAPFKGISDGLRAARLVKQRVPNLRLVLFGSVPLEHNLDPWMEYVRAPSNEEVAALYNTIPVFVVPSWAEGWGLPGMEAMACGAALCSTATGGVNEYAVHGETALISPPRDPERLAEHICALLSDDTQRIKLARAGVAAVRRFTWPASLDQFEQLVEHYVAARGQRKR